MRKMLALSLVLLGAGCKKGDGVDVDPVTFKDATSPNGVTADLPPEVVGAHDANQSLWGTMSLLMSDPLVLDLMENNGGTARGGYCWQSTPVLSTGVNLAYDNCDLEGISGNANVSVLPGQALAMFFEDTFAYGSRSLGGDIRFEPVANVNYAWALSPATETGQASTDPLIVNIGSSTYEIALGGHTALDFVNSRMAAWGNAEITGPDGTATVTYGASDPAVADQVSATPQSMKVPFFPVCRCMTGGTMLYQTTVTLTEVDLSVSNALDGAGTIWPNIPVPTSIEVDGDLILQAGSQCGTWVASFTPTGDAPVLPGDDLRTAVEGACTANAFGSPEACEQVRQGAADVSGIELELNEAKWSQMAEELADRQFDNNFCTF